MVLQWGYANPTGLKFHFRVKQDKLNAGRSNWPPTINSIEPAAKPMFQALRSIGLRVVFSVVGLRIDFRSQTGELFVRRFLFFERRTQKRG